MAASDLIPWPITSGSSGRGTLDLFLGTAVKNESAVVVTGAAYDAFSTDGARFSPSKNLYLRATPSVGVVPGR